MLPPTSFLPPVKLIQNVSADALSSHIAVLREIFTPDVRGSGLTKSPAESVKDQLRADEFEKSYSVRWLTALISCSDAWQEPRASEKYDHVLQEASRLLALFSGPSTASSLTRKFTFSLGLIPGGTSFPTMPDALEVVLRDISIDSQDSSSVGNQTWGSACILAEMIANNPAGYLSSAFRRRAIDVLELGAGTGLVSLVVAKLLSLHLQTSASVVATDFHPSVLNNLEENVKINFPGKTSPILSVRTLDWSMWDRVGDDWDHHFDLIIGADIIYESDHARWIKQSVEHYLAKPEGEGLIEQPSFHLIIPLRRTHQMESQTVETVFTTVRWVEATDSQEWALGILNVQNISRPAHTNDREDVMYRYYRIGWGVA